MITSFYIAAIALGVMIGACIVGIINYRQDEKDRMIERVRHETVCTMLNNLELEVNNLKMCYERMMDDTDTDIGALEKNFIRRCQVLYASMADEKKAGDYCE
jgi:hypothetical protein